MYTCNSIIVVAVLTTSIEYLQVYVNNLIAHLSFNYIISVWNDRTLLHVTYSGLDSIFDCNLIKKETTYRLKH